MICQLDCSFGEETNDCFWSRFMDIWSQHWLWSCWSSLGWFYCWKGSSHPTQYTPQNTLGHQKQKAFGGMFNRVPPCYIPDIRNPILHFAGGKCHWQRDIKEGIIQSGGVSFIFPPNTKVSCLEIKASTALWLRWNKYVIEDLQSK